MHFSVSSAELQKAFATVAGAIPGKTSMPILECVLMEREGDMLRLSATDLEISIVQHLPVQFQDASPALRVAVPAKRMLDTLRALPDFPVTFASDEDFNLSLRTDQGRYKMVGYSGNDFPALTVVADGAKVETEAAVLRRAIDRTRFAVGKDALRPAMMGIYFQIGTTEGRTVATDGHRLVRFSLEGLRCDTPLNFIAPEKALGLVGKVAADASSCTIEVAGGFVSFTFEHAQVLARLIDEMYPNYEAVIPKANDRRLTVNRASLLSAVKRVALYTSSTTRQVRMALQTGGVEIAAEDIERSSEAKEFVVADYDSTPMVIGFNADYLTEVLSNMDSEDLVLEFSTPNRAGVVLPVDQPGGEDLLMLIMPVLLNSSYG